MVPIEELTESLFQPSDGEIEEAHRLFQLRKGKYEVTVHKGQRYPEDLPELAVPEVRGRGKYTVLEGRGKGSMRSQCTRGRDILRTCRNSQSLR